jgi:hypothetical protein
MAGDVKTKQRPSTRWTPAMVAELRRLVGRNELFMYEIADVMRLPRTSVLHKCRQLRIRSAPPGRFAEWNRKHAHLREDVLTYFLTHSFDETAKRFGLTRSEMKSCMSAGYLDPKLKHLRKEWRPHTPWSTKDWLFMVRHAGVRERVWIAKKLKRGHTYNSVKDSLAKFRGSGKYMNGMPWQWASQVFGLDAHHIAIQTKAGPTGGRGIFRYRIIPWVTCERLISEGRVRKVYGKGKCRPERKLASPAITIHPEVVAGVRAMARFQRWIHGTESERVITGRIRNVLKQR